MPFVAQTEFERSRAKTNLMLNIPVILGSIRVGRKSYFPAVLLVEKLKAAGVESQLVDFKSLVLPILDCEKEPEDYEKVYPNSEVQKWSTIADAADGFIIVTPEYNHGYPSVLKNALDWLYPEYERKVVGLVGVSNGAVGGARAIESLRQVVSALNMFSVRETVMFAKVQNLFDGDGKLLEESYNKKIDGLIASVLWAAEAIKQAKKN